MFIRSVKRRLLTGHRAFSATAQQTAAPALALQSSTLENNVIVATKGGEEEMVSFSISLAAGSRHESPSAPGASNFLKHALFMSNKHESAIALARLQELRASQISISQSRDLISITAQCHRDTLLDTMQSIGFMLHPKKLAAHEMELVREKVRFERNLLLSNPQNFLLERVQEVAWRRGLANSLICTEENEAKVSSDELFDFYARTLTHQGTSAVATGVGHDVFARSLSKIFENLHYAKFGTMPFPTPKYHGGEARFEGKGDTNYSTIAFPLQNGFADVNGFVMAKIVEKLFVPQRSVQYGNTSSLLMKEKQFEGINNFTGSTQLYSNAGVLVFGLESSNSKSTKEALHRIKEATSLQFSEEDLTKAKSSVLFEFRENFESRLGFLRAAGEQIAGNGRVFEPAQVQQALKSITAEQVKESVTQVFSNKPSLVHFGNLRELPYVDEL